MTSSTFSETESLSTFVSSDLGSVGGDVCLLGGSVLSTSFKEFAIPPPSLDSVIMSASFIDVMASFIARSVTFTTFHPWYNSPQHLTAATKYSSLETPLRALGTNFLVDLSPFELISFYLWSAENPKELAVQNQVKATVSYVLERLARELRIRETEFLQGLVLLERMLTGQRSMIPFVLTMDNLPMVLVVSIMLAHKMNADLPFSVPMFCRVLGIEAKHLIASEEFFLRCVNFSLHVSGEEYEAACDLRDKVMTEAELMMLPLSVDGLESGGTTGDVGIGGMHERL